MRVFTLPGYLDSGPEHWQSQWEARHLGVVRVVQDDWEAPDRAAWVGRLDETVENGAHIVFAAHSMGCLLAAHWAHATGRTVAGALLVAVPDPDGPAFPASATGFAPLPARPLPFPAIVVASEDDPFASMAFSRRTAGAWGARLVVAGARGHINGESGLGDWPDGWTLVQDLLRGAAGMTGA